MTHKYFLSVKSLKLFNKHFIKTENAFIKN